MPAKAPSKTPEQIAEANEANKKLQGEKSFGKKKVNRFSKDECQKEISRLEKAGHQGSKYYKEVKARQRAA